MKSRKEYGNTMKKHEQLLDFMAKACHYAQEHVGCPDAWSKTGAEREQLLQCTSFQMACFLAQNTVDGRNGVEWEIVIAPLISSKLDKNGMMAKSVEQWKKILNKIVIELGGWNSRLLENKA